MQILPQKGTAYQPLVGDRHWLTATVMVVATCVGLRLFLQNAGQIHAKYAKLSAMHDYDWPQYYDLNAAGLIALTYLVFEYMVWPMACLPILPFYELGDYLVTSKRAERIEFVADPVIPKLDDASPRRVGLVVEPTPFTHISGYTNRFNEMLKYMAQAKDTVQIVTTDVVPEAPREAFSFPIYYTEGARFALYPEIILSTDMKDQMIKKVMGLFRPDLIHCVSPSFFGVMTAFVSKWLKIPLVLSYHTHLPVYAKAYFGVFGDWCGDFMAWLAWTVMRIVHNRADLTVTVSP